MKKHPFHPSAAIDSACREAVETTGRPLDLEYMNFLYDVASLNFEHGSRPKSEELDALAARFVLALDAWRTSAVCATMAEQESADGQWNHHCEASAHAYRNFRHHFRVISDMLASRPDQDPQSGIPGQTMSNLKKVQA